MNLALVWGGAMALALFAPFLLQRRRSTRDIRAESAGRGPIQLSPAQEEANREWVRIWRSEPRRRMPGVPKVPFTPLNESGFAYATISGIPPAHRERMFAPSGARCAICGEPTEGSEALPYNLHMHLQSGSHYGVATMAHVACFEACPEANEPAGVPW